MVNRFVSFLFLAPLRNQYLRSEIATKKHKFNGTFVRSAVICENKFTYFDAKNSN